MVQLTLTPTKGNAGGRDFPYQGYLGLTPVRVDGIVTTKLEEDCKPVLAKSLIVAVRCYESRQGKTGVTHSRLLVDYTHLLWRKPDNQEYAELGQFEGTFKITLPKSVPGFSTAHYQEYRTFWRVEAVIEHVPIAGVGSRLLRYFDLPLIRYDVPPPPTPLSPASPSPASQSSTPHTLYLPHAKTPTPVLHYNLSTPELPIGPSDLIFTSLYLRPLDTSLTIRSASVFIERRIDLHQVYSNANGSTSVYPSTPNAVSESPKDGYFHSTMNGATSPSSHSPPVVPSVSMPEASSSRSSRTSYLAPPPQRTLTLEVPPIVTPSSSSYSVASATPLTQRSGSPSNSTHSNPASPDAPSKTLTSTITYADSGAGGFARDFSTGVMSKTVSMQWPKAKSKHVWAYGESIKSELAEVSFWVKVKLIVSSSSFGTLSLDLEPREITIVSTNDSDRRLALAKFAEHRELVAAMREKSRDRERESSRTPGSMMTSSSGKRSDDSYFSVDSHPSGLGASSAPSSHHRQPRRPSSSHNSKSRRKSNTERPSTSHHHHVPLAGPDSQLHAHSTPTSTAALKPPTTMSSRPHTSAGPRDKANSRYTSPEPVPILPHSPNKRNSNGQTRSGGSVRPNTGMSVNEVQIPRSSVSSNHSHSHARHSQYGTPGAGPGEVGGASSGAIVGGSRADAIKAWEDVTSKRSTSDMLSFFGLSKRRRKDKEEKREKEREARRLRPQKGLLGVW